MAAYLVEAHVVRGYQRTTLWLQERQPEVLEDERGELVDGDLGLVVVDPRLIASLLAAALTLARRLLPEHVAHLRVTLPLADVRLASAVKTKVGQLQGLDRHLDDLLAVGGDDRFLGDDLAQVAPDRLLDLVVVAGLIDRPLAVQRPVVV